MTGLKDSDYNNILFGLVCNFLKKKNLLEKFARNSYEFHSIGRHEYDLPEDISRKEKIRFIIEHNVKCYTKSYYYTDNGCKTFYERIRNFFISYDGSFDWIDTGELEIWSKFNEEWQNNYSRSEINKLMKYGIKL